MPAAGTEVIFFECEIWLLEELEAALWILTRPLFLCDFRAQTGAGTMATRPAKQPPGRGSEAAFVHTVDGDWKDGRAVW